MQALGVIAAAGAAWLFGAVWYGLVGSGWMAAAGLTDQTINRKNYVAFIGSFIATLLVAGMMRHLMVTAGIDTAGAGTVTGLGLGVFIATPWIVTNYLFAQRPAMLCVYDGGYATGGSAVMGLVLGWML